jgi:hypothetical protein
MCNDRNKKLARNFKVINGGKKENPWRNDHTFAGDKYVYIRNLEDRITRLEIIIQGLLVREGDEE